MLTNRERCQFTLIKFLLFSSLFVQIAGCGPSLPPPPHFLDRLPKGPFRPFFFTVNSTVDAVDMKPGDGVCATAAGECTLRAAIDETNVLVGGQKIVLPAGMYVLNLGPLTIRDSLTLSGNGAPIIDGNAKSRVLEVDFRQWLICEATNHSVLRYSAQGQFVNVFVAPGSGGLSHPGGATVEYGDLNGDLFVSGFSSGIHRYDRKTGAPKALVAPLGSGGLQGPTDLAFGPGGGSGYPDRNLYVADYLSPAEKILRYHRTTGAFINEFIKAGSGGLNTPNSLLFRGKELYISSAGKDAILRYDGVSGTFLGNFVSPLSGNLSVPRSFVFGPDGNLYVASWGNNRVLRYNGITGAFLNEFVTQGSGGLSKPTDLAFGPDGHLYVISSGTKQVLRYNGATGGFLDVFIPAGPGGLGFPACLVSVLGIGSGPTVNISGVIIQNGNGPGFAGVTGGGGIYISDESYVSLTDSIVRSNHSEQFGGGIGNRGFLKLLRTTISNNTTPLGSGGGQTESGGGVFNFQPGSLEIDSSTISGNKATRGGGIRNWGGRLEITNSTISGNTANTRGGGIMNQGTAHISFSTITRNGANLVNQPVPSPGQEDTFGGGVWNADGGTISLGNTILAGNTDNRSRFFSHFTPDCFSPTLFSFTSERDNVVGVLNTNCSMRDIIWGDTRFDLVGTADSTTNSPIDPLLGPLTNNGGTTPTHLPLLGSPAIDKDVAVTSATFFDCPATDQRGVARAGTTCDIGAVER